MMKRVMSVGKAALLAVAAIWLAGCGDSGIGGVIKDRTADYKQSREAEPLEVPPDLSSIDSNGSMVVPEINRGGSATYSEYTGERKLASARAVQAVLPAPNDMRVERRGDKRWLVIVGEPSAIWPRVRDFWISNGFLLVMEDPSIGIMETDWAENRADIPDGPIRRLLGKIMEGAYSAATRDKFRVRLEWGADPGTTEVFLTHRGVKEVANGDTFVWEPRPSDPELEAEMLRRLMVFLGVEDERARTRLAKATERRQRSQLMRGSDGLASLDIKENFARAWRLTGLALDRVGFTVEDRDRSKGIYYVRYHDLLKDDEGQKKGFLSRLAFWKKDDKEKKNSIEYQVALKGEGDHTRVVVLDKDGKRESSGTATRILTLIHEQLQ
jgi:outer membrane protein assembly factor BamC